MSQDLKNLLEDRNYNVLGEMSAKDEQGVVRCTAEFKLTHKVTLRIGEFQHSDDKQLIGEFIKIGDTYRQMKHRSLPRLINSLDIQDEHNRKRYIVQVMDYVKGKNLEEYAVYMAGFNQLDRIEISTDFLIHLMQGVVYMEKKGIIHRFINPRSVMIEDESQAVRIVGFFTARLMDPQVLADSRKPDGVNLAPEMLDEDYFTSALDIWGTGLVYYYLLFGKYPWQAMGLDLQTAKQTWRKKLGANLVIPPNNYPPCITDFLRQTLCVGEERLSWEGYLEALKQFKPTSQIAVRVQIYHVDALNKCFEYADKFEWLELNQLSMWALILGLFTCKIARSYEEKIANRYLSSQTHQEPVEADSPYMLRLKEFRSAYQFYGEKYGKYIDPSSSFNLGKMKVAVMEALQRFMSVFQLPEYSLLTEQLKMCSSVCAVVYTSIMLFEYDGEEYDDDIAALELKSKKAVVAFNKKQREKKTE
jgi:serine/threonine protein kinase